MKKACELLITTHDFRNFCKINISQTKKFLRTILSCNIIKSKEEFYFLEIRGTAFLWHMVRCIMSILFLVGKKKENPEIIKYLFDINKNSNKPGYLIAHPEPLVNIKVC